MMKSWFQQLTNPQRIMVHVIVFTKKIKMASNVNILKGNGNKIATNFFYCFM